MKVTPELIRRIMQQRPNAADAMPEHIADELNRLAEIEPRLRAIRDGEARAMEAYTATLKAANGERAKVQAECPHYLAVPNTVQCQICGKVL